VAEDLALLEDALRKEWSYFESRTASGDVDVEALFARAREEIGGGCTRAEFARALRELVAGLHDGHADLVVPGVEPRALRRFPFDLLDCVEGVAVSRVADPGPAQSDESPTPGDLVLSIGGVGLEEAIEREERAVFGSTAGMRRRAALEALCRTEEVVADLELESPAGERRLVRVATLESEPAELARPAPGAAPSLGWPRPGVALLAIPSFGLPDWPRWLAATQEQRDRMLPEAQGRFDALLDQVENDEAKALILDLRGNPGGTDSLGIHVAERLLAEQFVYFQLSAKTNGEWTPPGGITYSPRRPYAGRVLLLIDAGTFSTASNLARCLRDLHPALSVVGRPDGAGTGAPRRIAQLPHSGAEITLCTHRVRGPAGAISEGHPTLPDRVVTWSRADLRERSDPDLAAALSLLE